MPMFVGRSGTVTLVIHPARLYLSSAALLPIPVGVPPFLLGQENFAGRFSRNARIPSRASSERNTNS